jgi:hypothetical protein
MTPHPAPMPSQVSTSIAWARISFFAGLYPPAVTILFFLGVAFLSRLGTVAALPALASTIIVFLGFLSIPAVLLAIVLGLVALRQAIQSLPTGTDRGHAIADMALHYLVGAIIVCFDILLLLAIAQQS